MTEDEFKNLKVGDVVCYSSRDSGIWLEKIVSSYNDDLEMFETTEIGCTTKTRLRFHYVKEFNIELLPLYNSPLYLAMQESDDD